MPESADRKPENQIIPLVGANSTGNGGVVVKNSGCKDISSEGASTVEKPAQKDAASLGIGVGTVSQPPGKVKSEVKDQVPMEKTAPAVNTAAPEGVSVGKQPLCIDVAVSAKSVPVEKAANAVEKPVTVDAASGCVASTVISGVTGGKSADAGVGTSDIGTVTDGSFDGTTNAGTGMFESADTNIDAGTGMGGPSDSETVMVCSADAGVAVPNSPGPAAVGASVSPQGSASGKTSGKDKKTPYKKKR